MRSKLLVVLLECHPYLWSRIEIPNAFTQCVQQLAVFCSCFINASHSNSLAFFGAGINDLSLLLECSQQTPCDRIASEILTRVRDLSIKDEGHSVNTASQLVQGFTKCLCYTNKVRDKAGGQDCEVGILVIHVPCDVTSNYLCLLNGIFAAQKMSIKVDAVCPCDIKHNSPWPQVASITGGTYRALPSCDQMLTHFIIICMPSASSTQIKLLPSNLDHRATCFCHKKLVETGWVCSVCLSVFCAFSPICTTCNAMFKPPPGALKSRKKKAVSK